MTRRTGKQRTSPSSGDRRTIRRGDMLLRQEYHGRTRTWITRYQERADT